MKKDNFFGTSAGGDYAESKAGTVSFKPTSDV